MGNTRLTFTKNQQLILFSEVEGLCPLCQDPLVYKKNKNHQKLYEIAHIYPLNPTKEEIELLESEERLSRDSNELENLICLCPSCHTKFDKPRTVEEYRELLYKKKKLLKLSQQRLLWGNSKIEKDIIEIITMLSSGSTEMNKEDILEYDPKEIDRKTNDTITPLTKRKIHNDVQDYFQIIKSKFIELDSITPLTTETVSAQIKTHYLLLCKGNKELRQKEIFDALVNWLSRKANQDNNDASEILISYFIQNCEVF